VSQCEPILLKKGRLGSRTEHGLCVGVALASLPLPSLTLLSPLKRPGLRPSRYFVCPLASALAATKTGLKCGTAMQATSFVDRIAMSQINIRK
jgi:hypothetical protein